MTYDELRAEIAGRHESLSRVLRRVAEFALDNPNDMALETVAVIADRAGAQPSSLIRFAKAFGFGGFTDMQRLFRAHLVDQRPSYRQRIRESAASGARGRNAPAAVLEHFIEAGISSLEHLRQEIEPARLAEAVELLARAELVHVIGLRRSFPVAAYLGYAFNLLERRTVLLDHVGGMAQQQGQGITKGDVLVAISFKPYAADTVAAVELAAVRGAAIIAITDNPLSPLIPKAAVAFEIEDAQVKGFRALTATMCLALSLVVALGQRLERRRR